MKQLYIDGKPAVIKNGSTFKFYRENIYFTNAEDYTFDVVLPLRGCPENIDIFSAIHRPEMSAVHLVGKKYPFHFIAPPLDIEGSAIVTEVNDIEVKVQLLAGSSVLNFDKTDALGRDIYIDELDLGTAYDISYPGVKYDGAGRGSLWAKIASSETLKHSSWDSSVDKCVCFPVYSEESGMVVNLHDFKNITGRGQSPSLELSTKFQYFAAQPYLLLVIERILNAIGYNLNPDNAIARSWQRNIFIANARNEYRYNRILPHWTVSEFLKEVSTFCGVVFVTDGDMVTAVSKSDYYSDDTNYVALSDVVDEYSTEISEEEEGSEDPRTGNVGYDFASIDPMLQLPDEVWEKAQFMDLDTDTAITHWASANNIDTSKSLWLFTDTGKEAGRTFAYMQEDESWFPCEVDQAGPIIRGDKRNREISVRLRIVPSMMAMRPVDYIYDDGGRRTTKTDAFNIPMLKMDAAIDRAADTYNVNDAINPNVEEDGTYSKPERIEVALFDGSTKRMPTYTDPTGAAVDIVIPLATGIPYAREEGKVAYHKLFHDGTHERLLFKQDVPDSMYYILNRGKKVDTRVRYTFQFLDMVEGSPKDVYVIRNRHYLCEKIEFVIDDQGVEPVKRGYFYEAD